MEEGDRRGGKEGRSHETNQVGQWSVGWMRIHGGRMRGGWVMYWQVGCYNR